MREYRLRGDFGINDGFPDQRQPYFVDDGGRRCAVAFLLDRTGSPQLTSAVAASTNHAWVADLVGSDAFGAWLDRHGLTIAEAARIQAPPRGTEREAPPPPAPRDVPQWSGPGDAGRGTGRGAGPRPANGGSRPASPRDPVLGASPTLVPGAAAATTRARGIPVVDLEAETWLPWFELQASRWLQPHELPAAPATTYSDAQRVQTAALCRAALRDADAGVRAAAVLTLGRLGRADAAMRELLEDPVYDVRCAAVVAFATAGTPAAIHPLLAIATEDVPHALRPVVLAALGGASRRDGAVDHVVAQLLAAERDPQLLAAAAAYARLGEPGSAGLQVARDRVRGDENESLRAVLSAAFDGGEDAASIAALTQAVSGKGLEMRRSAAAALGRSRGPLGLAALQTAFELEHDLATCAQLLVAIGEHGGDGSRDFLVEQMRAGRKPLRAWAAVALGIHSRDRGDAALLPLVRDGCEGERNRDAVGLWLLALGLLRDVASFDRLCERTADGSSETRAAAVWALALLGDPAAHGTLAARLREDACPFVRSVAADVLAIAAGARAVPSLAAAVEGDGVREVREAAAFALGATGDAGAVGKLVGLASDGRNPAGLRAAALRGLGRLLAHGDDLRFARLGWRGPAAVPHVFRWLAQLDR